MAGKNRNTILISLRSSHASTQPAARSPTARIITASMIAKYPFPSGSGSFQRLVSPPFSPTFIWRATVLNRATWLTNRLVFPVYRLRSFAIRLGLTRAVVILQTVIWALRVIATLTYLVSVPHTSSKVFGRLKARAKSHSLIMGPRIVTISAKIRGKVGDYRLNPRIRPAPIKYKDINKTHLKSITNKVRS